MAIGTAFGRIAGVQAAKAARISSYNEGTQSMQSLEALAREASDLASNRSAFPDIAMTVAEGRSQPDHADLQCLPLLRRILRPCFPR